MAHSMTVERTKLVLAIVGGSAVVAMAGFSVAMGTSGSSDPLPMAHPILVGPMTEGDTVTTTVAPTQLATQKAAPALKAPRYGKG
jgi:hypothetical protein